MGNAQLMRWPKNLLQVMTEMNHIVPHDELEVEVLAIRRVPDVAQGVRIDGTDQYGQLRVVHLPKADDLLPRPVLIPLDQDPFVAVVSRQIDAGTELQPHKSLVIIRCRI